VILAVPFVAEWSSVGALKGRHHSRAPTARYAAVLTKISHQPSDPPLLNWYTLVCWKQEDHDGEECGPLRFANAHFDRRFYGRVRTPLQNQ